MLLAPYLFTNQYLSFYMSVSLQLTLLFGLMDIYLLYLFLSFENILSIIFVLVTLNNQRGRRVALFEFFRVALPVFVLECTFKFCGYLVLNLIAHLK